MSFNCDTCQSAVRRIRNCDAPGWSNPDGQVFPIFLIPGGDGASFCPAKLFRDDQAFVSRMQELYLSWRLGVLPGETSEVSEMPEQLANELFLLIRYWEQSTRHKDFQLLGRMFGGEEKK